MKNTDTHPFGYWITAVDRLMRAEFATVFSDEGITRRDWRMLNRIDGTHGDRPHHGRRGFALRRLSDLGWIERTADGWTLTDAGALAKQRLGTSVDEIRARVSGVLTPDEYSTMTASLEKIAREFGWEEGKPLPRRHERRGRGRGGFDGGGHRHGGGGHGAGRHGGGGHAHDPGTHEHHRVHGCGHHGHGAPRHRGERLTTEHHVHIHDHH